MLRFGIDIDGTVTPADCLYKPIAEYFKIEIDPNLITTYNILESLDIPQETFMKWYKNNEEELCNISTLRENSLDILTKWYEDKELYYISARSKRVLETTKNWFEKKQLPYHHIEHLDSHNKVEIAKKYKINLFFEDKLDNAIEISAECNIPVILFDTPYNRETLPENVIRVNNWLEASSWVNNWLK